MSTDGSRRIAVLLSVVPDGSCPLEIQTPSISSRETETGGVGYGHHPPDTTGNVVASYLCVFNALYLYTFLLGICPSKSGI